MDNTDREVKNFEMKVGEQFDTVKQAQAEMEKEIKKKLKVRDQRDLLVKASLDGEIDRLEKQKEIIKRQNSEEEFFTYEKYLELMKDDIAYTATSYYAGQQVQDEIDEDTALIKEIYDEEILDDAIRQVNLVKGLNHLKDNLKRQVHVRTASEIKSKINRTMGKIDKKSNDETHSTIRQMGININSLYESLKEMAPSADVKHRKFIYSFCQYVDKYYDELPITIMHTIKAVEFLQFGTDMNQNEDIIAGLNEIYETL